MNAHGRIERLVVLMLENRSFDHMLGDLRIAGVERPDESHANRLDPSDPDSPEFAPEWITGDDDVRVDPGHGYLDVMRQLTGTDTPSVPPGGLTNKGFVWNYASRLRAKRSSVSSARDIMRCSRRDRVPVLSTLAREFAVCTRWFCSLPSETWPNRMFAHAAQSDNLVENVVKLYGHPTTFDKLDDAHVSWAVYAGDIPQAGAYIEPRDVFRDRFNTLREFYDDVERGNLPHYSFLEPVHFGSGANSQHPTQRVWRGEQLLKRVYEALVANREIWDSLLFVVTYDEHGGFFDHVPPVPAVPPFEGARDAEHGFGFDLLGPRVPAVVVSPFVQSTVDPTERDHASIVKTVRELFNIREPLTARDEAAPSVLALLGERPREPSKLPDLAREAGAPEAAEGYEVARWAEGIRPDGAIQLNEFQESLLELKRKLDDAQAARGGPEEVAAAPAAPAGPVHSEAELEAIVRDFRVRHMSSRARG